MRSGFLMLAMGSALAAVPGALAGPEAPSSHLSRPESAIYHGGAIYVTQMGTRFSFRGDSTPDGSIAVVDRTGRILRTLATNLVDPTGMALIGSTLWVNDVDKIRSFKLPGGAAGAVHDLSSVVPAGSFLNDLVADRSGQLWATNSVTGRINVVRKGGRVDTFNLPPEYGSPNGIALHPKTNQLWFVVTNGAIVRKTASGYALVWKVQACVYLDGLAFVQRKVVTKSKGTKKTTIVVSAFISDFTTNVIWKLQGTELTRRATLPGGPADLSYAAPLGVLVIPLNKAGEITTLKP